MLLREPARLEALLSGRVQGVGLHRYVTMLARRLRIAGWIENGKGGTVHVVAEGEKADLRDLLGVLERGSPAAKVEQIESVWKPFEGGLPRFEDRR